MILRRVMIIENVNKQYENKSVLKDFSATILEGKITAIMGPSGCGKTTLLRIMMGLETPDSGKIKRGDGTCAAVFQEDRLSEPLSALQNVRLGKRGATKERAQEILASLGLSGHTDKPVSALSGGMRRRVAIARAIIADADYYFLDEPFSALDEQTKSEVMAYVKEALHKKTVVFVTHDEDEARTFGDELLFL